MFDVNLNEGTTEHLLYICIMFVYTDYVYVQVVPGQAGSGSFQKNKPIGNGHVAG